MNGRKIQLPAPTFPTTGFHGFKKRFVEGWNERLIAEFNHRLNGTEIARTETYREGKVPLHTLRADIDYACVESHTTYGVIGVKVWISHGEKRNKIG